jgi:broad specificity phosphatase PhoE
MIKKYLILLMLIIGFQSCQTVKNNGVFTIYLVRHSEKDVSFNNSADPPLTHCGEQRSKSLSRFFSDVPICTIYSTDYTRTKNTAFPTAKSKGLNIQEYDGETLNDFSKLLRKRKQDALVVGHSNTTAVLAGLLIGEEFGEFDLDIYDRIYQVVLRKKRGRLHVLHTAFSCKTE